MKKRIEVLGVVKNGEKEVRKVLGFDLDVEDYLEIGTLDKVREEIRNYVRETGVFGMDTDVEHLNFMWDGFLTEWRNCRKQETEKKKKEAEKTNADPDGLLASLNQKWLDLDKRIDKLIKEQNEIADKIKELEGE